MAVAIDAHSALIVVDVQRDFCPGGALAVPHGDEVVPILNQYIERFQKASALIVATRDWHPQNHCSFKPQGGPWPPHCVQNTSGAEFHPDLKLPPQTLFVSKADKPDQEAYSGFEGTSLASQLRQRGITRLFVGGLATDYCVKNTALDGVKEGFEVYLLEDAIRGVDVTPGDSQRAIQEMMAAGIKKITLADLT